MTTCWRRRIDVTAAAIWFHRTGPKDGARRKRGAPTAPLFGRQIYLLDPACIPSPPSPSSSAYFFPWKRTPARVESLPFCFKTAASVDEALSRSTTLAGTLATTFLPCRMLTSTFGPLPSHSNL